MTSLAFVGIRGHVVALDRATGGERWRTRLKGAGTVVVASDGRRVIATTGGAAYCLDAATGTIVWTNPLRGLGFGLATIATDDAASGAEAALVASAQARRAAAAG
jgi:outer membrane protein assembly factor BamB